MQLKALPSISEFWQVWISNPCKVKWKIESYLQNCSFYFVINSLQHIKLCSSENWNVIYNLIQAGGEILRSKIHKLIKSIWNKVELPDQWKESIIVLIHKKGDKTDCSN
jgi:hypothetical protein